MRSFVKPVHPPVAAAILFGLVACVPPGPTARAPEPVQAGRTMCAASASADTTVYSSAAVNQQPALRTAAPLNYPATTGRRQPFGRVLVNAVVNRDGSIEPSSVSVVEHVDSTLDAAAQKFVAGSTMWPACRDGQAVRSVITVPVDFATPLSTVISPSHAFWSALAIGLVAALFAHGR